MPTSRTTPSVSAAPRIAGPDAARWLDHLLGVERKLDVEILPDLKTWDVRRYGGTQVAIRIIGEAPDLPEDRLDEEPTDAEG